MTHKSVIHMDEGRIEGRKEGRGKKGEKGKEEEREREEREERASLCSLGAVLSSWLELTPSMDRPAACDHTPHSAPGKTVSAIMNTLPQYIILPHGAHTSSCMNMFTKTVFF